MPAAESAASNWVEACTQAASPGAAAAVGAPMRSPPANTAADEPAATHLDTVMCASPKQEVAAGTAPAVQRAAERLVAGALKIPAGPAGETLILLIIRSTTARLQCYLNDAR